jgi:hypothetical protein
MEIGSFLDSSNEQGVTQTRPLLSLATAPCGVLSIKRVSEEPRVMVAQLETRKMRSKAETEFLRMLQFNLMSLISRKWWSRLKYVIAEKNKLANIIYLK